MEYQIRHYYDEVEEKEEARPAAGPETAEVPEAVSYSNTSEDEWEDGDVVVVSSVLRKKLPVMLCAVAVCALLAGGGAMAARQKQRQELQAQMLAQQQAEQEAQELAAQKAAEEAAAKEAERQARYAKAESWELLLASVSEPLLTNPDAELVEAAGSDQLVDARIVEPLEALRAAAKAENFDLVVTVGYRNYEKQDEIFQRYVRQAERRGLTGQDAQADAALYCAMPGTSDHQTALAVHLIDDGCQDMSAEAYAETDAYRWLMAHCAEYGFVLRYPSEKAEDTGFSFEPWHFRYVGVENATEMQQLGMCLEEYVAYLLR